MIQEIDKLKNNELQKLIKFAKGKSALLIVHPYHTSDQPTPGHNNAHPEKFERFIEQRKHEKHVTIIMDARENLGKLNKKFPKVNNLFFLETETTHNPTPTTRRHASQAGWQKLVRILKNVGLKKTIVGGRIFKERTLPDALFEINYQRSLPKLKEIRRAKRDSISNAKAIIKVLQQQHKNRGPVYGCAGLTATKLRATKKFRVKTTKHFN